MVGHSPEVGIVARFPGKLMDRLWVSGLQVLEPDEAEAQGYKTTELGAVVATDIRPATLAETMRIIAGPETKHRVRLAAVPVELGALATANCPVQGDGSPPLDPFAYRPLLGNAGLMGVILEARRDKPGLAHVSVDARYEIGRDEDGAVQYAYNRDHFDAYPATVADDVMYSVFNLGPGSRQHRIYPSLSRSAIGNTDPSQLPLDLVRYVRNHPEPESIVGYAFTMRSPQFDHRTGVLVVEACLGSPVAKFAHDGATIGSEQHSYALMSTTAAIPEDTFLSLV